jgi:hypothetical protein
MWLPTLIYLPILLDWEWWTTQAGSILGRS